MSLCESWASDMDPNSGGVGDGVSNSNNTTISPTTDYMNFDSFYHQFRPIYKYLCTTLCILGIAANGITIAILTRPRMKSTANTILTLIAACDFALMFSTLIYVIYSRFLTFVCEAYALSYFWMSFQLFHGNLCVFGKASSLWLAVILAGYRKHLLGSKKIAGATSSTKTVRIIVVCLTVVFLLCVPMFVEKRINEYRTPESALGDWCPNGTMYYLIESMGNCVLTKVVFWVTGLVFKFLPCCLLAYCLVWIIFLMINRAKKRAKQFQRLNSANRRRTVTDKSTHRTTLILTVILSITFLCELPCAIVSVLAGIFPEEFFNMVYIHLGDLFDALSLFNGITTFPLYCFMSAGFRNTFFDLFSPCKNKHQLKTVSNCDRTSL